MMNHAKPVLRWVFWSLLFGLAYAQAPLYYSNQNQYFLHGLARAGWGHLDRDWLANTADPTPVFSGLVEYSYRLFPEEVFHLYYLVIFGVYLYSMVGLFKYLTDDTASPASVLVFVTLLTLVHSAALRVASVQLTDFLHSLDERITVVDYPWYFQAGLAGQYVLGAMFQPSVFGVMLVASILAFLRGRPFLAVTLAAIAASVNTTYLLGAAFLTIAYLAQLCRTREFRRAGFIGTWSLLLVLPVVVYNLVFFGPTQGFLAQTPEEKQNALAAFKEAQSIIAHFRIPHHAEPARWFDLIAGLQVLWVVAGVWLVRRSRLLLLLLFPFLLALALTGLQLWTDNDTLALLFPWRISAVLVPIATAIFLTKIVGRLGPWLTRHEQILKPACLSLLGALASGGVAIVACGLGFRTNPDELKMMDWVRANKRPNDVFLLPVEVPDVSKARRGAASTNFTPAPRAGKAGGLIAIDLQRFRLYTGAPIYVDFKAIPYKDVEVLEWRWRLVWYGEGLHEWLDMVDRTGGWQEWQDWLKNLSIPIPDSSGVTHVVVPARHKTPKQGWLVLVYSDDYYHVYRLRD